MLIKHRGSCCLYYRFDPDAREEQPPEEEEPDAAHLERLADDERERFLDAVMVRLGERSLLDYVRLNIVARRR